MTEHRMERVFAKTDVTITQRLGAAAHRYYSVIGVVIEDAGDSVKVVLQGTIPLSAFKAFALMRRKRPAPPQDLDFRTPWDAKRLAKRRKQHRQKQRRMSEAVA